MLIYSVRTCASTCVPHGQYVDYKWLVVVVSQAPDLFSANHAAAALDMVEAHLVGPLGMKTLDNR